MSARTVIWHIVLLTLAKRYKRPDKKCPTCDGQLITFEAPIKLNDYVQMRYTLNAIQKRKKELMALCAELEGLRNMLEFGLIPESKKKVIDLMIKARQKLK